MNMLTCHPDRLRWLLPLIQAEKKFHSKCRQHHKDCNMYCIDCLGDPICPYCCDSKLEPTHKGHTILQIFNTTHKKAVKDHSIKELMMDSSGIQKLMNNGDNVICIGSRLTNQNQNEFNTTTKTKRCKTCMFRLPTADFQFCSIHCKVKEVLSRPSTSDNNFPAPSSSPENNSLTSSEDTKPCEDTKPLPRQKPRKQKKPFRSPLM